MSTTSIIITLIVSGALLWIINNYIPIADKYISIINIVFGITAVAWLLNGFGIGF